MPENLIILPGAYHLDKVLLKHRVWCEYRRTNLGLRSHEVSGPEGWKKIFREIEFLIRIPQMKPRKLELNASVSNMALSTSSVKIKSGQSEDPATSNLCNYLENFLKFQRLNMVSVFEGQLTRTWCFTNDENSSMSILPNGQKKGKKKHIINLYHDTITGESLMFPPRAIFSDTSSCSP